MKRITFFFAALLLAGVSQAQIFYPPYFLPAGSQMTLAGTPSTLVKSDGSGGALIQSYTLAPTALTATIAAGAGVDAGTHSYKVTFVTAGGETDAGAVSNTVTTAGGNLQVNLTNIPTGNQFVTARNIYRTVAGNAATGPWLLQSTIANNTAATLSDNTADAALGAAIPSTNTALDTRATINNAGQALVGGGTSALPAYSTSGDPDTGFKWTASGTWDFISNGTAGARLGSVYYTLPSNGSFQFSSGAIGASGDTFLTRASAGTFATSVGTGTATANIGGTYAKFVSGTGVGNGADTTDDALWTLTAIPANTFTANGDALVLTLGFFLAATANNKHYGVTVGGTSVATGNIAANNTTSEAIVTITRVDATHVNVVIVGPSSAGTFNGSSLNLAVSDLTTNTLAVVVTGASPTTGAAGDVKLYSGVAEFKK